MIKLSDTCGNLGLNDQPAVWKACHRYSRFEQSKIRRTYSRKSAKINSKTDVRTLNHLKQQINRVRRGKKGRGLFKMVKPDPTLVLPLQRRHHQIRRCFTRSLHTGFGTVFLLVIPSLKKHIKGINFTCDEEKVW